MNYLIFFKAGWMAITAILLLQGKEKVGEWKMIIPKITGLRIPKRMNYLEIH